MNKTKKNKKAGNETSPRCKKKKKTSNHYFTEVHEKAIVDYSATEDNLIRTKLYVEYIEPAFDELVDKIIYTYRFTNLPNIENLRSECKIWLTTLLDKFDTSKGSKAFSYFSVITKNWFIHETKKNANQMSREVGHYTNIPKELEYKYLADRKNYITLREEQEFWNFLLREIENWEGNDLKENEKKVLNAIKILLSNMEKIEIFNKKAIYLYIREITDMNTKQVVACLNKLRTKYHFWRKKWDNGNI